MPGADLGIFPPRAPPHEKESNPAAPRKRPRWTKTTTFVPWFPSRQARSMGDSRTGGEGMEALAEDEAMAWLEERGFTVALEMFFGDKLQEA